MSLVKKGVILKKKVLPTSYVIQKETPELIIQNYMKIECKITDKHLQNDIACLKSQFLFLLCLTLDLGKILQ